MHSTQKKGLMALCLGLAMICSLAVHAQNPMPLAMDKAIELSLQNSKQLKVNKAKIEAATGQLKHALDNRLPDAKISGAYMFLTSPNIDLKTGESNGGGSSAFPRPNQAMYGMASVNMPLYSGLKIRYGIESAKFLEKAAEADAGYSKEEVILNTINAYCNLYKSISAVKLVTENLGQSQQRDKDFQNLEKNGLLARNDLLKAQLQTANIELALVNAENNLKLAMVSLNLMMGLPDQTILQPDTTGFEQPLTAAGIETYVQQAFSNRKDIEALSLRKKAAGAEVNAVKGEYYPSIGLTGGYAAGYIPKLLTATNIMNIGVGLQYNLGSLWKAKSTIAIAKANEKEIEASQEMLNDHIKLSINKAYLNFLSAQKRIEVQGKSVINATENYRITKNKHDNNLVTTTELLDANVALLESQIALEEAKADIVMAYNSLLEQAGILLNNQSAK
ncbi:outer membrane protein TolC [Pseudobacter ginsenosidimutans]|uniref:Outer membrane protein TolC n=2 Tax=Pseudobacter ginsenosidimutans TaxID=661488 RepID=A0A4Q7N2F9_9BACT|nr:outer membrane protein TolC [Pseudobacter ginsenosidimutans]